ncbi:MAG TPA: proline--tRNA ligase [Candidatus Norongarragalinales archaeon]|nr:proline--tRNA ligase [Candidatus Norongarragalinales archaeon]
MVEMKQREFNIDKKRNFSEWYNTIIYASELADIRYNIKGFLVHRPWSALAFRHIYRLFESELEADGHMPVIFPTLIPEENFLKEKEHVEGFAPEVFWVTQKGEEKLDRRLALRPTSETAFYQMYNLWVDSFRDLPLKLYQSCSVFRAEKETNPFLRGSEFLWIETHDLFETAEGAQRQTAMDLEIMSRVATEHLGIAFIPFERPQWDKFAGAEKTYAYDCLMPDGKAFQFGSTHLLGQHFTLAFEVSFTDAQGNRKNPYSTCFGPGIWRVLGAVISVHGDQKGLIMPYAIAPIQVIIVPISKSDSGDEVLKKAIEIKSLLLSAGIRAEIDKSDRTPGFKYNWWEMRGVPFRIELGSREVVEKCATLVRRDTREKIKIGIDGLVDAVLAQADLQLKSLKANSEKELAQAIRTANTKEEAKRILEEKGFARIFICTLDMDGRKCAEDLKEFTKGGKVRGIRLGEKPENGKCIACGRDGIRVYFARQY